AAEFAFGAYLARHAGDFAGERIELIHHRVDGVLELEDLASHVHGDLARHVGDVAHLHREVAGHRVHVVGEILPRATDTRHARLAAQPPFGAYLARHA